MLIPWKEPERETEFFYKNNAGFRHYVDLQLAVESMDKAKRVNALKKLYFEYRNEATFKKGMKLQQVLTAGQRLPTFEQSEIADKI